MVEVLVGTFLLLLVFLGIFGAYRASMKLITLSKNRTTAIAIASGQIEKIRNLNYNLVGTKGATLPNAEGILDSSTTTIRNGTEFNIETSVKYISDDIDGVGGGDDCNLDYKRADVRVSWGGFLAGEVRFSTDIMPKDLVEEANSCASQPGGILSVQVFDALGNMIDTSKLEVFNPVTGEKITEVYTPSSGKVNIPLATSTYKIVVSKNNYSTESTYASGDIYNGKTIITPESPHPIVLENQLVQKSFSIDRLGSFSIDTYSTWGTASFSDSFNDETKISSTSSVLVSGGKVELESTSENGYTDSGYVISKTISPSNLDKWSQLIWSDFKNPATTTIKYQLLYFDGSLWAPIPESDLPGNSSGFENSPVNLTSLSTTTYPQLRIKANLSTQDASTTPSLYSWQITWLDTNASPIGNISFDLRGEKIVGKDASENPIYKYSASYTTDSNGHKDINNLEWDLYTFSIPSSTGLDLVGTDPSLQPINLSPGVNQSVKLYIDAENSLLITVQNNDTLEPIFSASVRLYKTGYDKTQYTNEKGQTLFIPLSTGTYNLEIGAGGYSSYTGTVNISGDNTKIIGLTQQE